MGLNETGEREGRWQHHGCLVVCSKINMAELKILSDLPTLSHLSILHNSFPCLSLSKLLIHISPFSLTFHRGLKDTIEALGNPDSSLRFELISLRLGVDNLTSLPLHLHLKWRGDQEIHSLLSTVTWRL